jgi:VIT1/CCC1 family predicted Fe2+/Mn2+ transporter
VALLAGALSMGVGEYLGGKSEREVVKNAIALEKQEMADKPQEEFAEQVAYYRLKGFTADEATMIVKRLATNPEVWLHEMMRDEFGIDPRIADDRSLRAPLVMAGSFTVGGLSPLVPYFFPLAHLTALWAGVGLAAAALFTIGALAGRLSARNPLVKGAELVGFGTLIFAASYLAGQWLPALFGHPPVSAGG